jgi:hypothetical protein
MIPDTSDVHIKLKFCFQNQKALTFTGYEFKVPFSSSKPYLVYHLKIRPLLVVLIRVPIVLKRTSPMLQPRCRIGSLAISSRDNPIGRRRPIRDALRVDQLVLYYFYRPFSDRVTFESLGSDGFFHLRETKRTG